MTTRSPTPAQIRAAAARLVAGVLHEGRSLDELLAADPDEGSARGLKRSLVSGTLRWHFRLRGAAPAGRPPAQAAAAPTLLALLEVGLFQLVSGETAPHAAVAETVNAARELGHVRAAGFVNAVLRRFQREGDALLEKCVACHMPTGAPGQAPSARAHGVTCAACHAVDAVATEGKPGAARLHPTSGNLLLGPHDLPPNRSPAHGTGPAGAHFKDDVGLIILDVSDDNTKLQYEDDNGQIATLTNEVLELTVLDSWPKNKEKFQSSFVDKCNSQ